MGSKISQFIEKIISAADPKNVWPSVQSVTIPLKAYGPLFFMVGQGDIFNQGGTAEIFTKETKVVLTNFPKPGHTGVYTGDKVIIQNESGNTIQKRLQPRLNFHPQYPFPRWDQLDILYFFGYALWNYTNFPYVLKNPEITAKLIGQKSLQGEIYDQLEVIYPRLFHTHSARQLYRFNQEGLLVRHDYNVQIAGPIFMGQHFTLDYARTPEGIAWATRRRVQLSSLGLPWSIARFALPLILKNNHWASAKTAGYAIYGDIDWYKVNKI